MRNELLKTAFLIGMTAPLYADTGWTGTNSSDPTDAGNWDNGLPDPGNGAIFINDTSVNEPSIATDISAGWDITIGGTSGVTATANQNSGTVATGNNNWLFVGNGGGTGNYNITGDGSFNAGAINVAGWAANGSQGNLNINTSGTVAAYATQDRGGSVGTASILVGEAGGAGGNTGTITLENGTLTAAGNAVFGHNSTGNLNMSGGAFDVTGNLIFARNDGSGTLDLDGGNIGVSNEFWIGTSGSGNGSMDQSGGTITTESWVAIGRDNVGTLTMTGGTFTGSNSVADSFIVLGSFTNGNGTADIQGGTFESKQDIYVGESGAGELNVSGTGLVKAADGVRLGVNASGSGTVNLNGGVIETNLVSKGGGTGTLNLNGGTLRATADNTSFISGVTVDVQAGGAVIDSNGFNVTSAADLSGVGSLEKLGAGSLTLAGTGNSVESASVSAGTLFITGQLGTNTGTTVDAGAAIGGNGTLVGNLFLDAGATIDISLGALTIDPSATVSFGGFDIFDILGIDLGTAGAGTYGVLEGSFTLDSSNLANLGEANAADLGGGRSAYFEEGSLNLVVVPEPSAFLLSLSGSLLLFRRRRS